jgi:arginine/ornithine N-succinyltransferase beta subunit
VDPFDGGPYYGAAREAISCVRERRQLVLPGKLRDEAPPDGSLALISAEGRHGFRATVVPQWANGSPCVSQQCREALGVVAGDRVSVTPLP